ncbi:MAG TPA: hypothetical protein VF756_23605 [Thermoanaerobaculia bacterium]
MRHLTIPVLAVLLLSPQTVSAYNRDTHQHLVELAYGYLKLVDLCEPVPLAPLEDIAQCAAGCRTTLGQVLREQGGGYTCDCVETRCESRCGGETGYSKYLCVNNCVERGPGFPCSQPKPGTVSTTAGTGQSNEPQCKPPYFLSQVEGETIVEDACGRKCCEERSLMPDAKCGAFCGVTGSGTLPVTWAKRTVEFYQRFEAPACPSRDHYQYHAEKDRCAGDAVTREIALSSWRKVPLLNRDFQADAGYLPIQGDLLQATNPLEGQGAPPDLTGTVIGLHTGLVDNLDDLHTGIPIIPVGQDFVKGLLELTGGAFGLGLAAVVGIGGVVFCGISCPLTPIDCSDCFGGTYDAAKAVVQKVQDVIEVVEEQQLAVGKGPTTFGKSNTSMFHFMADPFFPAFEYDDVDGYRPFESFGPGGVVAFRLHEDLPLDQVFDVRVLFGRSKRALRNYQPQDPDDGMEASFDRGVFYWHRLGMAYYTFPPADNMTYYWWHKWLEGRVANFGGDTRNYSLLPMAVVLHGVQDLTQPFHAWGISLQGHADEENRIARTLDQASAWGSGQAVRDGMQLLIDLTGDQERLFLERVGQYLLEIRNEVLKPDEGVLHSRRLMHFLYEKTRQAQRSLGFPDDISVLASWWDYHLQDQFLRETAIPLAVAATVTVLVEGAREDMGPYQRRLKLERDQFEREGDVPPLTSAARAPRKAVELADVPPGFEEVYTEWACVGEQPRAQEALRRYVRNETSGRDLLAVLLAEKARCELLEAGLPVPGGTALDAQGRYEARQLEASLRWFSHGSSLRLGRDLACNNASPEAAALVSPAEAARASAVCAGTVDSDGDGVLDALDRCWTPRALLDGGVTVRSDGCAFVHETFPEPTANPFLPGAIRRRRP